MRKIAAPLFALLCFFSVAPLHADVAAIHASALPQEVAVLAALDDAREMEPYSHDWTNNWKYPIAKEEVAARLGKDLGFLTLALKDHPQNAELLLLTGLVARYAYNVDVNGSYDIALNTLNQAQKLAPADMRAPWFRATLDCQTAQPTSGADEFLAMESAHPWEQLPTAFWDDYMECALVADMPAHVLHAADHLEKMNAAPSPMRTFLTGIAHKRFDPYDPKKDYAPKEVWQGTNAGDDAILTSTTCGLRLRVHGTWGVENAGLGNGVCIANFSTGPYDAVSGKLYPEVLVLARQPKANETLQDFAAIFATKGTFAPFTPSRCPATACIAMKDVQPGMYKEDGDGHGRIIVFERDEPAYPGLIFESPQEIPKGDVKSGQNFYRPGQIQQRIPGKLYYLVALDTAASIEAPAMKDFNFFLDNLTVE